MTSRGLVPLMLVLGCVATETGNPLEPREMIAQAFSSRPDVAQLRGGTGVSIDELWMNVNELRFEADCVADGERLELGGPLALDLIDQSQVLDVSPERSEYCRLRLRFEPSGQASERAPPLLQGHSLYATGTLPGGRPFVLLSSSDMRLERRSETPFSLASTTHQLMLAFDVGAWLEGVDLASGETGDDGVVHVDGSSNSDLLEEIEERLESAFDLYDDQDADGLPSDGDRLTGG